MRAEVRDLWDRAVQALETARALVHRDLVKTGRWPAEAGAAFSWLASLRYTGDYGGEAHVAPEEAQTAAARAALVLATVRESLPELLPPLGDES